MIGSHERPGDQTIERVPIQLIEPRSSDHAFHDTNAHTSQREIYIYCQIPTLFSRHSYIRVKMPPNKMTKATAEAGGEEVLVKQDPRSFKCGVKQICLYSVYMLVAKHGKLKPISKFT